MPKNESEGEYEVGYKKPPKKHQFKPGNPGGPGRPRKTTLATLIEDELFKNEGEKAKKIAQNIVESAAYRNMRAVQIVLDTTIKK